MEFNGNYFSRMTALWLQTSDDVVIEPCGPVGKRKRSKYWFRIYANGNGQENNLIESRRRYGSRNEARGEARSLLRHIRSLDESSLF